MKKYKVLTSGMESPFQGMHCEIGVEYHCPDFDSGEGECSRGFYATDLEGWKLAFRLIRFCTLGHMRK